MIESYYESGNKKLQPSLKLAPNMTNKGKTAMAIKSKILLKKSKTIKSRQNLLIEEVIVDGDSCFDRLPASIVADILLRLSMKTLCICRCVSKTWSCIIGSDSFNKARKKVVTEFIIFHQPRDRRFRRWPIITYLFEFRNNENVVNDIATERLIELKNIQSRLTVWSQVVGYCNGLVCILQSTLDGSILVHNPIFGDYVTLPPHPAPHLRRSYNHIMSGFGYANDKDEYKVVRMSRTGECEPTGPLEVEVYTIGTDEMWRRLENTPYQVGAGGSSVFMNGIIHWMTTNYYSQIPYFPQIVGFDVGKEKFRLVPIPDEYDQGSPAVEYYVTQGYDYSSYGSHRAERFLKLGVIESFLSIYAVGPNDHVIWTMREYGVKQSWTKLCVAQGYSLFIHPLSLAKKDEHKIFCGDGGRKIFESMKKKCSQIKATNQMPDTFAFAYEGSFIRSKVLQKHRW